MAKVAEVLLDSRRRSRNSGKIEYLLIGRLASILAGNLWNEKKSCILSRGNFAGSICYDLQRLLQIITDAARKVTSAQYAAFFLIPEVAGEDTSQPANKEIFDLAAISGATPAIEKHFRHLGHVEGIGVLEPVFWGGVSVVVDDVLEDPRYVGVPHGHIPVRSFLGVQLRTRDGSILGAFLIGDTRPSRFSSRHVELIEALSAQAAVAIHNAQLVARERRAMEEHAAKLESEG